MKTAKLLLVVIGLALAGGPALAQQPSELTEDERKAKAADYYNQAQDAFDHERYEDSVTLFRLADQYFPAAVIDYNIAKSYERMSSYPEALKYYESYLTRYQAEQGNLPPDAVDVQKTIEFLKQMIKPDVPEVLIDSEPSGANVYLMSKDKVVGQTPHKIKLEPGSYKLFLTSKGFRDLDTTIQVAGSDPLSFMFRLDKVIDVGTLEVKMNIKDASIFIDGQAIGLTPLPPIKNIGTGEHQVVVKKERYTDFRQMVKIERDGSVAVSGSIYLRDPPASWRGWIGWSSTVLGILAIGGGVTAYFFAEQEYNTTDTFKELEMYQNIGYGAGGGLIGVGFSLLIWEWVRDVVDEGDLIEQVRANPNAPAWIAGNPAPAAHTFTWR